MLDSRKDGGVIDGSFVELDSDILSFLGLNRHQQYPSLGHQEGIARVECPQM